MARVYPSSYEPDSNDNTGALQAPENMSPGEVSDRLRDLMSSARNTRNRLGKRGTSSEGWEPLLTNLNTQSDSGVDDYGATATGRPSDNPGRVLTHVTPRSRFQFAITNTGAQFVRFKSSDANFHAVNDTWTSILPGEGSLLETMFRDKTIGAEKLQDGLLRSRHFSSTGQYIPGASVITGSMPADRLAVQPRQRPAPEVTFFSQNYTRATWPRSTIASPSPFSWQVPSDTTGFSVALSARIPPGLNSSQGVRIGIWDNQNYAPAQVPLLSATIFQSGRGDSQETSGRFGTFPSAWEDSDEYSWQVLKGDETQVDEYVLGWASSESGVVDTVKGKWFRMEYLGPPPLQGENYPVYFQMLAWRAVPTS